MLLVYSKWAAAGSMSALPSQGRCIAAQGMWVSPGSGASETLESYSSEVGDC